MNKKLIDPTVTRFDVIHNINNLLIDTHANTGDISRIYVEFKGEDVHSEDVYSKYDLDIAMHQFMIYPYELIGLNYEVLFTVAYSCIDEITLNPGNC